jgi:CO/xanthine dehydrogenase FAD-binding subunit
MDRPIVMAVAHRDKSGAVLLALAGVAPRPVIVEPDRIGDLDPPSDFRGSSEYRAQIASILADRVLGAVTGGEQA